MRRVLFAVALIGLSAVSHAQFTKEEQAALSDALFISNLSLADLARSRATAGTHWTLNATADPDKGLEALSALSNSIKVGTPYQVLAYLRTEYFSDGQLPSEEPVSAEVPVEVPAELRDSVSRLAKAILTCNERIRQGLQKLSPTERRTLIEAAPRFASLEADPTFDFVKQPLPSRTEFNSLIAKVDFRYIRWAAQGLSQALQLEIPKLKDAARQGFAGNLRTTVEGVTVEIGGIGDDRHHDNDVVLAIDLGGNDHYSGRYGAGVGYGSLCIDFAGDDTYEGPDLALGAGAFGVGLLYDLQGDDVYRGKSICLGSGIGGVGILFDDQGSDDFRSSGLSAGFGAWGIGFCIDSQGIDRYLSKTNSQGSAREYGVGILFDRSGDDEYRAAAGKCGSQGAGIGSGGLGVLLDAAGDDRFNAGNLVQGYGGSEGVGALMDGSGADVYVGNGSCQGVGVGMGTGYLVDSLGQDTYLVTQSPGQGFGGDRGMGVLLDRSGDDLYAGGESHPAAAVGNGVAIFFDAGGDDRYQGPTGIGSMARGSGSLAAFVDLSGQDRYFEGLSDGQAKVESSWGTSLDVEGATIREAVPGAPSPGSKPVPAQNVLSALYSRALADDGASLDEFVAIGEPALRWALANRLGEPGSGQLIGWLALQIGGSAEDLCVAAIDLSKPAIAQAAFEACLTAGFARSEAKVLEAFSNPMLDPIAIRLAGALAMHKAVPNLMAVAGEVADPNRLRAITSLGQIGDAASKSLLEASAESANPDERAAAVNGLSKIAGAAAEVGKRLMSSELERTVRVGVQLLATQTDADSIAAISEKLSDSRRGVVIQALTALDGRVPRTSWQLVTSLRQSSDPLIKAVARRIDLGR